VSIVYGFSSIKLVAGGGYHLPRKMLFPAL